MASAQGGLQMVIGDWSKVLVAAATLALAACGSEAPAEAVEDGALAGVEQEVPVMGPQKRILAFGDSLFAGYGVGLENSYPAKLQNALRARGTNAIVVNAGVSGDTTAAGRQRIAYTLDSQAVKPDLVIVELGGNDILRSLPPTETRANLDAILTEIRKRDIDVLVMGMRSPPNLGSVFSSEFDDIYPELANEHDAELVPFFLESIYTKRNLFQSDRIHPTVEGIEELVTDTVDEVEDALD
ncbi:arylesterase [Altererythrobacter arenosus]|uniref:Arylesterase n=1 Tax=Altererythrobacter arenosus TaxID=3032592 RepID=A0ABY8FNN1_9SPHN|nr:arylesterase [Altererythrobacter sp. CAU 1644]WFL76472.1 arylesterase [Altererythrobacter sp. CAU 1644]